MKKRLWAAAVLSLCAAGAQAGAPTALLNQGWAEYTGAGPIGNNNINNDTTAYWMQESTGTWMGQAVKSWFVFWDPAASADLIGSISFHKDIAFVLSDKASLGASGSLGKAGVAYDYSRDLVGLEKGDKLSWAGNTLQVDWTASNPGDHIRVLTAVPEPSTYAMLAAGLLAVGFMARRRNRAV